jgi:hypothetical protein
MKYLNPTPDLRRDKELQKGYSGEVKEPKNVGSRSMFRNKKKINIMNYHSAPIPGVPWVCFPFFFFGWTFRWTSPIRLFDKRNQNLKESYTCHFFSFSFS